jgi:LacI family transcriptional regulator, repressor for deo operon, udp, cdd, tsx, nupC, and nupG
VPRIGDVARAAGVSTATVSRALTAPDQVRPQTRDRVLEAVRTLGYTPNAAARNLRAGRSRLVLVIIPRRNNPPFFSEVLHGIDVAMSAAGYAVITGNFDGDAERARHLVDLVSGGHLDGILILSGQIPTIDGRSILDGGLPIVSVCAELPGAHAPAVLVDDAACAKAQLRHLLDLGHRRLFYIAGPDGNYNEVKRFQAVEEAMAEAGLPPEILCRHPGNYMFSGGVDAARTFLAMEERPTGVIACNDEMAIGFVKTVRSAGLRIPDEVSVIGFDGIEMAEFCEPTLTTIRQPRFELGSTGARALLDAIAGDLPPERYRTVLQGDLLVGGSTGPATLDRHRAGRRSS